jgi:peptide/nickel transport system permease protein
VTLVELDSESPPAVERSRAQRPMGGFLRALLRRLIVAAATVFVASVVVFAAVEVLPRDPARTALGNESTVEQRELFRDKYGLNDPASTRYLRWGRGVVHGDFGESVISHRPITDELWTRLKNTAILASLAVAISVMVGIPLAMRAAKKPGGAFDLSANLWSITVSAVPEFVLGLTLVYVFASRLDILPVLSNNVNRGEWKGLVLPSLTLGLAAVSYVFRFARLGVIEAADAPFVRAARLRGVPERRVRWRHVLPVASSAVVNVVALNAIYLLGGVIVVESVFAYPGLGTLLVTGVRDNDLPMIEAVAVVTAALLVLVNVIADVVVIVLNPRLRQGAHP